MNEYLEERKKHKLGSDPLKSILLITAVLPALLTGGSQARADDVAQQARRLLAKKCFVCHGPDRNSEDAKETDLRLDLRNVAQSTQ